nr:hypothetical protein [Streptomyces albus]
MDRVEERLFHAGRPPRHARAKRHLRLVPGGRSTAQGGEAAAEEPSRRRGPEGRDPGGRDVA